jgi:hypothetical protein
LDLFQGQGHIGGDGGLPRTSLAASYRDDHFLLRRIYYRLLVMTPIESLRYALSVCA